ncbi:MAG: glycosyltransferase, partial [Holophagales bacterium]|nr:glycosyltransferase [Holophagales bacterium]
MADRLRLLFLTQTYPRFDGDTAGPFIRDLARALVAGGDRVTVLTPHATEVPEAWDDDGVEVRSFRYAPEPMELVGYSRSLDADEKMKRGAMAVAPLYAWGASRALSRELDRPQEDGEPPYDLVQAHWVVPNGLVASRFSRRIPVSVGIHGSDVFLAEKSGVRRAVRAALRRIRTMTG